MVCGAERRGCRASGRVVAWACSLAALCASGAAAQAPAKIAAPARWEASCGGRLESAEGDRLRALLEAQRWAELDAELDRYQKAYERDVTCEARLWIAFNTLVSTRPERLERFGRWIDARPRSYVARSLRGNAFKDLGYQRRGTKLARDTSPEQFAAMREAFAKAREDLEAAIALRPRHPVAYGSIIETLRASGDQDEVLNVLARLLAVDPINYGVRRRTLDALSPRWGGSLETMEAVALEAQAQAERNPRLRVLLGFPHAERGRAARFDAKDPQAALEHYTRALEHGEYASWRLARYELHYEVSSYEEALADAERYVEAYPNSSRALLLRGRAAARAGRFEAAFRDLDQVVEWSPRWAEAFEQRGLAHQQAGHWDAAERDYRRLLELRPGNAWAQSRLAEVASHGSDGILPALSLIME